MATIKLTSASLLEASSKIEDAANRIDEAVKKIDAVIESLDSVWDDQNSKQYSARYHELRNQELPKFQVAAHRYSEFLAQVVDVYRREFMEEVSETVQ